MWKCRLWGCICAHARAYLLLCVCMCVCGYVCVCVEALGQAIRYRCSCLGVRRGKWMRVCVCVCECVCTGGSCGVVKRRLVKDGQHWYDQSSVDQDVLLPPRCSSSLWISPLTLVPLFLSMRLFVSSPCVSSFETSLPPLIFSFPVDVTDVTFKYLSSQAEGQLSGASGIWTSVTLVS